MSDDVRRMSETLAQDPASRVFVPLGEALRRQGQRELAVKIALRGLERHPHLADAHDLLARLHADNLEIERAFDEWDMVLRLSPGHLGALKGMGFICFHRGDYAEAERYLGAAAESDPHDAAVSSALEHLRAAQAGAGPVQTSGADAYGSNSRLVFADVLHEEGQTGLLLDGSGLVLAGVYVDGDGEDVTQAVGAELSGVTDAAQRATRLLALGDWTSIVFETEVAVVAMAPSQQDGLLVVATSRATPLGLVRRLLGRCAERARQWLAGSE